MENLVTRALTRVFGPPSNHRVAELFGYDQPKAGKPVTAESSFKLSAVFSACNTITNAYATSRKVLKRRKGRDVVEDEDNELFRILTLEPNPYMAAFDMWRAWALHMLQHGNGYIEIQRNQYGDPISLWLLSPDWMTPVEDYNTGALGWKYEVPGLDPRLIFDRDMLHWCGPSYDGVCGLGRIELAKECISEGLAQNEYGATFFRNSAAPGGYLARPVNAPGMTRKAKKRMREDFEKLHRGLDNAHRIALLEEGTEFKTISLKPEETQFIQSKKFTVEDVARYYDIPLHMLKVLDRSTFNNIASQDIGFVTYTMTPHYQQTEQQMNRKLLSRKQYGKWYIEHDTSILERADKLTETKIRQIEFMCGFKNQDEVRQQIGYNPIDNGNGTIYYIPSTVTNPELTNVEEPGTQDNQQGDQGRIAG